MAYLATDAYHDRTFFVITVEPTAEIVLSATLQEMNGFDFLVELPLALPMAALMPT